MFTSQLCSALELTSKLQQGAVKILDGSWFLPSQGRDAQREFEQQHIPQAQFFNIDAISDPNTDLPHMLPSAAEFAEAVSLLGINNQDHVVIYDSVGLFSAARVWWMFRVFGHQQVQVLDGGLPVWRMHGGQLSDSISQPKPTRFKANLNVNLIASRNQLVENLSLNNLLVLDARSADRFFGKAPEPRPGLPSGHMPNSISLPFNDLIKDGKLKSPAQLRAIFTQLGVTTSSQIITSCGSGVTAAVISLALTECGFSLGQLYDGSWAEWGSAEDAVIINKSL